MDYLIGGHITLGHMYKRMLEHDLTRTNVAKPLWIMTCLVTNFDQTTTCFMDETFKSNL